MFCERWRNDEAPRLLQDLSKELTACSLRSRAMSQDDTSLYASILIAAGRFLDSGLPWCTVSSRRLAQSLLSRRTLKPTIPLLREILATHLRRLFTSPTLGSVTEDGRLRHETANLVPSAKAGLIDEVQQWKGQGGVTFAGALVERNIGAGSHVILSMALCGVESASKAQEDATTPPLESLWPLIVPPLMTLLQDSDPVWRLRGVQVLLNSLLTERERGDHHHPWTRSSSPSVSGITTRLRAKTSALTQLDRSNLLPLIRETLSTNLTYLTHKRGVSLFAISLETLLFLADYTLEGESRTQAEEYMRLVQDGILRTWTFMPSSSATDTNDADSDPDSDLLSITFIHLTSLAQRLGPLRARYVNVGVEFLVAQVGSGLYESLRMQVRASKVKRAALALRAVRSLIQPEDESTLGGDDVDDDDDEGKVPPNVLPWCTPSLIATCKAWIALLDHGLVVCSEEQSKHKTWRVAREYTSARKQVSMLVEEIRASWALWRQLAAGQSEEVYERVRRREKRIECVA